MKIYSTAALCAGLAIFLAGCGRQETYRDFTGQNRGLAQLQMDGGYCQELAAAVPPAPAYDGVGGALVAAGTTIQNRQNVFDACMQSRGWQRVQ